MRIFALVLAVLPSAAVRLGGTPAMQVYTPLIAPERRPLIAGNWKLNPETAGEAAALLKLVAANQRAMETSGRRDVPDVALFPPFPFLPLALELLRGTSVKVGAQNIGLQTKGAFTGEVSASQVASLGCECVLLGHSERRALFDEDDETINAKVHLALGSGLRVVLCVGETQAEYEMELVGAVCEAQLKKGLKDVSAADAERIVVAYEPVWAIGTGLVATPEQAQAAHAVIRRVLGEIYGDETARRIVIQYGGSVTPESIDELIRMPDIDGALVGGASLVADKFSRICEFTPPTRPRESPRVVTAREVVSCKNTLGESPVWSARDGRLHWVSAPDSEVWSWDLRSPPWKCSFAPQTVGCCALKAGGGLLVALEEQIVGLDVDTRQVDDLGIRTPEPQRTTRLNDGRVDRSGNFVVGMYNLYHRAGASGGDDNAGLYRLQGGALSEVLDYSFRVSNAICFSPDGGTAYFCDTPTRKVYAFDYAADAPLQNRRLVYTMPAALAGGPDGAQVDADGHLWLALSGAGQVARVDPATGETNLVVALPVSSPTSLTFGGDDLATLFITTRGPDGGGLYACEMPFGIRGLAEPEAVV